MQLNSNSKKKLSRRQLRGLLSNSVRIHTVLYIHRSLHPYPPTPHELNCLLEHELPLRRSTDPSTFTTELNRKPLLDTGYWKAVIITCQIRPSSSV